MAAAAVRGPVPYRNRRGSGTAVVPRGPSRTGPRRSEAAAGTCHSRPVGAAPAGAGEARSGGRYRNPPWTRRQWLLMPQRKKGKGSMSRSPPAEPREENILSPPSSVQLRPELYIDSYTHTSSFALATPPCPAPPCQRPSVQPLRGSPRSTHHSHSFKCSGAMSSIGTATALATRGRSLVART